MPDGTIICSFIFPKLVYFKLPAELPENLISSVSSCSGSGQYVAEMMKVKTKSNYKSDNMPRKIYHS